MNINKHSTLQDLVSRLRQCRSMTAQAVAAEVFKFNQLAGSDCRVAMPRARLAIDLILRSVAVQNSIVATAKPARQIFEALIGIHCLPSAIEENCRMILEEEVPPRIPLGIGGRLDFLRSESEMTSMSESLVTVVSWYVDNIAAYLPAECSYKVFTGPRITREILDDALGIDPLVYPEPLRGIPEVCREWLKRNPDIFIFLVDPGTGGVVGCINAMPLEPDYYRMIERGDRFDVDLPAAAIKVYDRPGFYVLYFCSIALHPSYQSSTSFKTLYSTFIDKLLDLARQGVLVTEILANAVTPEGVRLCKILGLREVNTTGNGSTVYKCTLLPPTIRVTSSKAKALVALYQGEYEKIQSPLT